jgi:CheY-like chemotaxis protein
MNPISILVADDATDTLEVIAMCLRDSGHDVTCATGGRQAMSLIEDRHFDLIITDILMPDADGMEVIMAARRNQPDAQVIAMSGGGDFFSARHLLNLARALGADQKLTKPFSRATLLETIDRVCSTEVVFAA